MRFCPDSVQPVRPRPAIPYTGIPSPAMRDTALKLCSFAINDRPRPSPWKKNPWSVLPPLGTQSGGMGPSLSPTSISVIAVWKPGTTAQDRRRHHADLQAWADEIRASLPLAEWQLLERAHTSSGPGSADLRRALEVWKAGCAIGPQPPVSNQCDNELLIDFEFDTRSSEDDRAGMRSLAERGRRRWLHRYGSNG